MAEPGLTLEKLMRARDILRANKVPAYRVEDRAEADEFTRNDPFGHKWRQGDEYYLFHIRSADLPANTKGKP